MLNSFEGTCRAQRLQPMPISAAQWKTFGSSASSRIRRSSRASAPPSMAVIRLSATSKRIGAVGVPTWLTEASATRTPSVSAASTLATPEGTWS